MSQVVVVRDGEPDALVNPPATAFAPAARVTYVHLSQATSLPVCYHVFFNCARADARVYALCDDARRAGAHPTFVVRYVDRALARYVADTGANLIPAYGFGHQITQATVVRAARRVLAGYRMVAHGFIRNSIDPAGAGEGAASAFVHHLSEASRAANGAERVVAAVLSPHRTGSNFLRDLIGMTVSGRVDVFHEHEVPPSSDVTPDPSRPLFDQSWLERDGKRSRLLRRAWLREALLGAARRLIVVAERPPDDRLVSYFQRRHLGWLQELYDRDRGMLRDQAAIRDRFHGWLKSRVRSQQSWYRRCLTDAFGISVLDAVRTPDGLFVDQRGANTLLVVPTATLAALRETLVASFGGDEAYAAIDGNSVRASRIGAEIDRAFRRQIPFPTAAAEALWRIPEVARVHGVLVEPAGEKTRSGVAPP